ncbi:MAG TPA: BON domain-containing protein [Bryobacteraceae bacterium]|nr:BON domain-containing protein [Bryobacteraceae bacterium]
MSKDIEIRDDVERELFYHFGAKAAAFGVAVEGGIVTLTGTADNYAQKLQALRAAERIAHVKAVACDIQVRLPGPQQRTDADLARTAANVLSWHCSVPPGRVRIGVENGWIKLQGTLNWRYQVDAAVEAVANLTGVRGVDNRLIVDPLLDAVDIKTKIEAALERSAIIDGRNVLVEVENDKVALHGEVRSIPESEEAERIAWSAPGVADVANHLLVVEPARLKGVLVAK